MINVFAVFFMMGLGSVSQPRSVSAMPMARRYAASHALGLAWAVHSKRGDGRRGILMWITAQQTGEFFANDPAVYNLAATMIAWVAMALVFDTGQSLMAMALRARGDTWAPTFIHFIAYGVVMIPLAYLYLPLGRGAMGLADGYLGTFVPFVLVMLRYRYLDRRALQARTV